MNFDFGGIESGSNIITWLVELVKSIFSMFNSVCDAMYTFYDMLKEFNATINNLCTDPSNGSGLPVIQAIGVVRYLVGDLVFYFLYIIILFGCLSTLYRLICLLIEAKDGLLEQVSGKTGSSGFITGVISKFLKS